MAEFFVGLGIVIFSFIAVSAIIYVAFIIAGFILVVIDELAFRLHCKNKTRH